MISTKGRYSLRVLEDLAEHRSGGYIPIKDIAERQEISQKYLEQILPPLTKAGLVEAVHGRGGGYRLTREPDEYSLWEVLTIAEGEMVPVACLAGGTPSCRRAAACKTLPVWMGYYKLTREYFSGITIADLAQNGADNYSI